MEKLKIVFMGTPDFARAALRRVCEDSPHEVVALYSQPPRPRGRGHKEQLSATHEYAQAHDIPVFTPRTLKDPGAQAEFAALGADVAVVAAYGLILPRTVLEAPRFGCLNIHASLLPRWRGASPIQRAIWAGDAQTGVTIMRMDEGLDTGPMISKRSVLISEDTNCAALHDELAALGGEMIVSVLDDLAASGRLEATAQDDVLSTYAPLLSKEDGRVEWGQSAQEIGRQVRALNPWPGVWTDSKNERLKILSASVAVQDDTQPPGTILDKQGHVQCGNGSVLRLLTLQPAGKKVMDFASAVNGGYLKPGERLEG